MKIEKFTKENVELVLSDINAALTTISDKYQINFDNTNIDCADNVVNLMISVSLKPDEISEKQSKSDNQGIDISFLKQQIVEMDRLYKDVGFNEYFAKMEQLNNEIFYPLFKQLCKQYKGLTGVSDIFDFVKYQDANCMRIPNDEIGVICDTNEWRCTAFIDYDCGTTFIKYCLYNKLEDFKFSNAIDVGYLSR